jgi:hypothetical protein
VDHGLPAFLDGQDSQSDDKVVSHEGSHQQTIQSLRAGEMAFLQVESPSFLVREACLNFESSFVNPAGLIGTLQVRNGVDGLLAILSPPSDPQNWSIATLGEESLRHNKHTARLDMGEGFFVRKPMIL